MSLQLSKGLVVSKELHSSDGTPVWFTDIVDELNVDSLGSVMSQDYNSNSFYIPDLDFLGTIGISKPKVMTVADKQPGGTVRLTVVIEEASTAFIPGQFWYLVCGALAHSTTDKEDLQRLIDNAGEVVQQILPAMYTNMPYADLGSSGGVLEEYFAEFSDFPPALNGVTIAKRHIISGVDAITATAISDVLPAGLAPNALTELAFRGDEWVWEPTAGDLRDHRGADTSVRYRQDIAIYKNVHVAPHLAQVILRNESPPNAVPALIPCETPKLKQCADTLRDLPGPMFMNWNSRTAEHLASHGLSIPTLSTSVTGGPYSLFGSILNPVTGITTKGQYQGPDTFMKEMLDLRFQEAEEFLANTAVMYALLNAAPHYIQEHNGVVGHWNPPESFMSPEFDGVSIFTSTGTKVREATLPAINEDSFLF